MGDVTDIGDRGEDLAQPYCLRLPAYPCPLGDIVDMDIDHALEAAQVFFIQPQAGRTANVFQQQRGFAPVLLLRNKALLDFSSVVETYPAQKVRYDLLVGGGRRVGTMTVVVVEAGLHDGLADGLAAVAAERSLNTIDHQRGRCLTFRHRQAAMKTVSPHFLSCVYSGDAAAW